MNEDEDQEEVAEVSVLVMEEEVVVLPILRMRQVLTVLVVQILLMSSGRRLLRSSMKVKQVVSQRSCRVRVLVMSL